MKTLADIGVKIVQGEPMSKHTTWAIGGPAEWYAEVHTPDQLKKLLEMAEKEHMPFFLIGAGSNLLVGDGGVEGVVVRLKGDFEAMSFSGQEVRAGAGVFLPNFVRQCAEHGLGGIEPLVGVPGTVGGALHMNAGTRVAEIGKFVTSVDVLGPDLEPRTLPASEIRFEYRSSSLAGSIICFADFRLAPGNKEEILKSVQGFLHHRLETQPIGTHNAGSVFKNPPGRYSGQLIEQAGLKGLKMGRVQVSEKHANFIENCGGATAEELKMIVAEVQRVVQQKSGVWLEPEFKTVGK